MRATTAGPGLRRQGPLDVLAWPSLDALDLDAVVTTRHGGVSTAGYASLNLALHVGDEPAAVLENRRRVAAALGADQADFVFCDQSHGNHVATVTAADRGRGTLRRADSIAATDAVVTRDPGTVLVVLVADCVPIILVDPEAQVLGCVHAGWRGTVARTARSALAAMCSLGAHPEDVIAGIGPSVAAASYQVGEEVAAAARDAFGENVAGSARDAFGEEMAATARDTFAEVAGAARDDSGQQAQALLRPAPGGGPGQWLFDLPAANRHVLRAAGVPDGQIHVVATPTGPDPGLFFSHRAERPCGRFALAARLEPREQR
jgi:polyphenol oxidase